MSRSMQLRIARGALVAAVALAFVSPGPARSQAGTPTPDPAAHTWEHQRPWPGFVIAGAPPILLVNGSLTDRQVLLCWKPVPAGLLEIAHQVAAARADSCLLESRVAEGRIERETWWLDRARGLLVCPTPAQWFERTGGKALWEIRCPSLGVDSLGGDYNPALLAGRLERGTRSSRSDTVYVTELPEVITRTQPEYPEAARQAHVEGIVLVKALIDSSGAVSQVLILRSIPALDQAAMDCVKTWHFKPGLRNNRPIALWISATVEFRAP